MSAKRVKFTVGDAIIIRDTLQIISNDPVVPQLQKNIAVAAINEINKQLNQINALPKKVKK